MSGALRAEWLRLRRRPDVWLAVATLLVALGALVAVVTRSITTATVMTLTILLVEAVVSSSVRSGPLRWIADYSPTGAANAVIENAHRIAGAVPPVDDFARIELASPPAVPPLASLVVALGWLAGLLAGAFLVFERADIKRLQRRGGAAATEFLWDAPRPSTGRGALALAGREFVGGRSDEVDVGAPFRIGFADANHAGYWPNGQCDELHVIDEVYVQRRQPIVKRLQLTPQPPLLTR